MALCLVDIGILVTRTVPLLAERGELIKLDQSVMIYHLLTSCNSICSDFMLTEQAVIAFLIFKAPYREEVYPLLY